MNIFSTFHPDLIAGSKKWQFLKDLFDDYQNNSHLEEEYKIPKSIHIIWLGSPLPEKYQASVDSWKIFHPEWSVKIWTDRDAAEFGLINQDAFDQAQNFGEKSDIFRYEILYRYGGLYVDTDFECLQPFDELHKNCEFYAGIGQNEIPQIWIGLIGSVPGHPILKATIDHLKIGTGDNDFERIMVQTGTYHFTNMFFREAPLCSVATVVAFPVSFFYPFPGGERWRNDKRFAKSEFIKPESMAIHYFDTSWQKE